MTISDEYLSIKQAADELGVSESTIWRWVQGKHLPAMRFGPRTVRIRRDDLRRALSPVELARGRRNVHEKVARMTNDEMQRARKLIERLDANAAAIHAAHAGQVFPDAVEIIREAREERSRRW